MRNKLFIIGASGHGKVIADIAIKMNLWNQISFLDDNEATKSCMGYEVIGKSTDAIKYISEADLVVAIGDNAMRERIQNSLLAEGASFATLIHPHVIIGTDVEIDEGSVVMAGAVINCCTSIGKGCIINTGSTIDHDNIIEDYVHISPGVNLAGTVKIGKGTWIGVGSTVKNNVSILSGCIVGAGAVVIKDITRPGTYVGLPARRVENGKDFNSCE